MFTCTKCGIEVPRNEIDAHLNSEHPEVANDPSFRKLRRTLELLCRQVFDTGVTEITVKDLPLTTPYRISGIIYESRNNNLWSTPTIA